MPDILEAVSEVAKLAVGTSDANVVHVAATLQRLLQHVAEPGRTIGHCVTVDIVGRIIDAMLQDVDEKHRELLRAAIRAILLDDFEGLEDQLLYLFLEGVSDSVDKINLSPVLERVLGEEGSLRIPARWQVELEQAAIGYNKQDTRYIAVTEDLTLIRDPDNMIVFRTAEVIVIEGKEVAP